MKKFLTILLFSLSLITSSQCNDIKDFEIDGMGLGDSLLNYYSEGEINKYKYFGYKGQNEYFTTTVIANKSEKYDYYQFNIRNNDKNYIIESIEGSINIQSMSECIKIKENIEKDVIALFPDLEISYGRIRKHPSDPSGLSKGITTDILFNKDLYEGPAIRIMCVVWSDEIKNTKGWSDSLRVILNSKKFNMFLEKVFN